MGVDFVQREFFKNKLSLIVFGLKSHPVELSAEMQRLVNEMNAATDSLARMAELQDEFWEKPEADRQAILDEMVAVIHAIEAKQKAEQEEDFSDGFNFFDD